MARNRLIKKEFFRDEKVGELCPEARLLFISLWIQADDSGHGRSDARLLAAEAFPYDGRSAEQIEEWLQHIAKLEMIELYEVDGQRYYKIPNWKKHQTINNPSEFRYPRPHVGLRKGAGSPNVGVLPER